jgi:predicted RNase H-like HicB family nuclease
MNKKTQNIFPVVVEKDEDNSYVVECPVFQGCYSSGKTLDQALKNIKEVISMCLEEKENKSKLKNYSYLDISFHSVSV